MEQSKLTLFDHGIATELANGETEAGDHCLFLPRGDGFMAAVVDGLGHGPEAAEAARLAIDTVAQHASDRPDALIRRCHETLRQTRGAAMGVAEFTRTDGKLRALIVGAVQVVVIHKSNAAVPVEHVLQRSGIVGGHLPTMRISELPMHAGDTLVMATDGIRNTFLDDVAHHMGAHALAEQIVSKYWVESDDALVLVVKGGGGA